MKPVSNTTNIYSGYEQTDSKGHETLVNNNIGKVICSKKQKLGYKLFYLLWLTIIGGIIFLVVSINKTNQFKRQQIEINNSASNIEVQLQKRSDTLIKLLDATKGYMEFEKDTLKKITAIRTGLPNTNVNEKNNIISEVARGININVERYPDLKSDEAINKLMTESAYIEKEIAANRRLYNQNVTTFNQEIFTFPWCVLAERNNLSTIPLFSASEDSKKDTKLSF